MTAHPEDLRYARGLEIMKRVGGEGFDRPLNALRDTAPELVEWAVAFAYGDVLSRPVLDLKLRELVTVAALAAAGNAVPQLRYHIRGALNLGATRDEVLEVLFVALVAAGLPPEPEAANAARESVTRAGETVEPVRSSGEGSIRRVLDARVTALSAVAACTTLGADSQLRAHLHAALDAGCPREELVEVLMQMAVYAGFPAALNGISTAKEVFAQRVPGAG